MKSHGFSLRILVAALLFTASSGLAENWFTRSGEHESFFFRLAYANVPSKSLDHSGPARSETMWSGVPMRLWAGWSVAPRWIVHVALLDPMVEWTDSDEKYQAMLFGAGMTRYFDRSNVFLSGQFGFAPLVPPSGVGTKGGLRWTLALGKEIQISKNNGIGAMLTYDGGHWEDPDTGDEWSLLAPGIQLVWTVN